MMRKGLFNYIVIAKDVHSFVYIFVRIMVLDVIKKMAPSGKESGGGVYFCYGCR